ncbi:MAG: hypothetical protein AAF826_01905 [Pseudomonadota bacterium]
MTSPMDGAIAVLRRHITALNERDEYALIATLHFSHFRLSGTDLKIWDTAGDYFGDFTQRAGGEWSHTNWAI